MFYISRNVTVAAPATLDVTANYDALFLSASSAKVFSQWYGFAEIPYYDNIPCTEYYSRALSIYAKEAMGDEPAFDAVVHNHTGAMCGVFAERVMLKSSRASLDNALSGNHWLGFSSSATKCATPMQLMQYFERNASLNNILLVTGDIADNEDLRVNPVALSSDTINLVKLTRTESDIAVVAVSTLFDGEFSGGIYLESNDRLLQKYNEHYQLNVAKVVGRCLDKAKLSLDQIDVVLPHNVNVQTWKKLTAKLGISMEKVYARNIARFGHCFGGDVFVNLGDYHNEMEAGQTVHCLAVAAGIGASFGATIFKITK